MRAEPNGFLVHLLNHSDKVSCDDARVMLYYFHKLQPNFLNIVLGELRSKFELRSKRAHPDLNQGPADLQSAALTTELCTRLLA